MELLINAAKNEQKVAALNDESKIATMRAVSQTSPNRLAEALLSPHMLREMLDLFGHEFLPVFEDQLKPHGALGTADSKAKRPLNAFMAFRTYYLKLFPDTQQKNASGFLTQLWGGDPHRNKWALIAKVYSFLRDQLGKGTVNLSAFLGIACPLMNMVEPSVYIEVLGWQQTAPQGVLTFQQNTDIMKANLARRFNVQPTTEIDLLTSVLSAGYFTDFSQVLLMRMWACQNGIMTTTSATAGNSVATPQPLYETVPTTAEKTSFINAVRESRNLAAQDLFGVEYDAAFFGNRFVHSWEVHDLASFQNVQISVADSPMESNTLYNFHMDGHYRPQASEFDLYDVIDTSIIDISSAWSIDQYLHEKQSKMQQQQ
uniref:MAT1-1-1 protein carrying alpha-box domain n=2 Tax=Gibberella sacchari TaxID=42676 RepID=Q1JUK0_GIBSA|nr:mating type protein MAT1-1-1 [Fusarium sacchari]BAE94379.1 MAT1-1-1 protein carrying alpha-box domain [Fusarium sacchari]